MNRVVLTLVSLFLAGSVSALRAGTYSDESALDPAAPTTVAGDYAALPGPGPGQHPSHGHIWPKRHHNWNYYKWHFNPTRHPWYWYGYDRYSGGFYPGYDQGFVYTGYWRCTGYDDMAEDHDGGHAFRSTAYEAAYDAAEDACDALHDNCVVSCERES